MSNIIPTFAGLRRTWRRRRTIEMLMGLDDHMLRDIGLARGSMVSLKSADGRPRGLYADMIQDRLRQF
jgi:hypothetical protein